MREHDPLGLACRAGRVDDRREVARLHLLRLVVKLTPDAPAIEDASMPALEDLFQGDDLDAGTCRQCLPLRKVDDDDGAQ